MPALEEQDPSRHTRGAVLRRIVDVNGSAFVTGFRRFAYVALGLLVAATALAAFGAIAWVAELASHFRAQYAIVALALAAAFLFMRRGLPALVAVVMLGANGWYVMPYLAPAMLPDSVAAPPGRGGRLVALNLLLRNRHYVEVRDYLRSVDADVLVVSELTPEWVRELRDVTARYPYWMSINHRSPWGLGVYSRYPLRAARSVNLGVPGSVNVNAVVEMPAGAFELMAVHLSSPVTPARAALRNHQLDNLAGLLGGVRRGADALPRLLVGDMNVTPYSVYLRDFLAKTGLQDARRAHGLLATWPTWMPPAMIPIDQCLTDPALEVTRLSRGPDVGSDHYPLEVAFALGG